MSLSAEIQPQLLIPRLTTSPTHAKFLSPFLLFLQDCCIGCVSFPVLCISLVFEVTQNFSVLELISLLHIPFPAVSQVSKGFNDFQLGLKKLEEYMSCLTAAEVNGMGYNRNGGHGVLRLTVIFGSAMQRHTPAGGRWVGILMSCSGTSRGVSLQSAVRCLIRHRCSCSPVSELLSLSFLRLFNLKFYTDVDKLQTHTSALQKI